MANNSKSCKRRLLPLFLYLAVPALANPVAVGLSPTQTTHAVGDTFTIDLSAQIPSPVIGWGLDLDFDHTILLLSNVVIGPSWFSTIGTEPNDYGGLAFPSAISGPDTLLAALTFTAIQPGSSSLTASFDSVNLNEGFALETGGFADVVFTDGVVDVQGTSAVPEPNTRLLLALALGVIGFIGRDRNSRSTTSP